MNYKLTIAFDGSKFCGWQFQKNAPTVQGAMTETAKRFFGEDVTVTGCSRTDSGVHAQSYVCSVRTSKKIPCDAVVRGMNTLLPDSIAVKDCETADESFHPRYDCISKEYRYTIRNLPTPDPFSAGRVYNFSAKLNAERMDRCAKELLGRHEFDSFMASGSKIVDTSRTVYTASVTESEGIIIFSVSADGFLYNMVRIIVGTLIDLDLGRTKLTMSEIIEARDRKKAGFTAPPDGLVLYKVNY